MNDIKKNYLYNTIFQILNMILPLVTAPYVSRVLGAEGVGTYSYTYSVANYFVIFSMLGIANYGSRSCAQVQDDRNKLSEKFCSIYIIQFVLGCVMTVLFGCTLMYSDQSTYFILQLPWVLCGIFDISWFYSGIEKFKMLATRNILIRLGSMILVFWLVKNANDLWKYILILSSSLLISQLMLWVPLGKSVNFRKITWNEIKVHIKPIIVLFIPVIAVNLYKYMDKVMLGSIAGNVQVGLYDYAEKLTVLPLGLINSLGAVMIPRMSSLFAQGNDKDMNSLTQKSMSFVLFLSASMCFGLLGVGNNLIPLLFGSEYKKSVDILYWLAPSMIFVSWANVIRTQYLIPRSYDRAYIVSVGIGALVNLIVNAILIPNYGGIGAAIGTLFAEASVCIVQSIVVWKAMNLSRMCCENSMFLFIGFTMYVVITFIELLPINQIIVLCLQVVIGITIALMLSWKYVTYKGWLSKNEIKKMVKKNS